MEQFSYNETKMNNFFSTVARLKEEERSKTSIHLKEVIPEELTEEDMLCYEKVLEWKNKKTNKLSQEEREKFNIFSKEFNNRNRNIWKDKNTKQSQKDFSSYLANVLQVLIFSLLYKNNNKETAE